MQTERNWDRADPFVIEQTVESRHIDGLGHTNNLHYLAWLQRCAWRHSLARGFGEQQMVDLGNAMAVRETRMHYLAATYEGDVLLIGDWITACDGRLRATRSFQILRPADQVTVMRARIDYVCIRIATGRPARMPAEFVRAYQHDLRD